MSIHSRNEDVILQFGLKKPAYRIVVNTPTTLGSIGFTTSLDPVNDAGVRRLGRQHHVRQHLATPPPQHQAARMGDFTGASVAASPRRQPPGAAKGRHRYRKLRPRRRLRVSRPHRLRGGSMSSSRREATPHQPRRRRRESLRHSSPTPTPASARRRRSNGELSKRPPTSYAKKTSGWRSDRGAKL